jgi:hypothetical protein
VWEDGVVVGEFESNNKTLNLGVAGLCERGLKAPLRGAVRRAFFTSRDVKKRNGGGPRLFSVNDSEQHAHAHTQQTAIDEGIKNGRDAVCRHGRGRRGSATAGLGVFERQLGQ